MEPMVVCVGCVDGMDDADVDGESVMLLLRDEMLLLLLLLLVGEKVVLGGLAGRAGGLVEREAVDPLGL